MKKFTLYESFGSIDDDILERSEKRVKKRAPGKLTRWGALAACACLAVVTAFYAQGFFAPDTRNDVEDLTGRPLDETGSDIAAPDGEAAAGYDVPGRDGEPLVSVTDAKTEAKTEAADLSGGFRDNRETLTLQEGLETETLGAYLLAEAPRGFRFESLKLSREPEGNILFGVWTQAYDYINWKVSLYNEADAERLTTAADTRNYDMSLYPIPLCDSVPEELRQIVDHPIFSIDELTQDVVNRRACYVNDSGDTPGPRMSFGVLYGEVLVEVTTKGVSPEWLYERLSGFKSDTP